MIQLTDRQEQVLGFINSFRRAEQCNPTCAEIARHFGWRSANAAQDHLDALKRKSVIHPRDGSSHARGYKVAWPHSGELV